MKTLGITAADHQAAGELIHNEYLAVLYHIILILGEQGVGPKSLLDIMVQLRIFRIGQRLHFEPGFGFGNALRCQLNGAATDIAHVVAALHLLDAHELIGFAHVLHIFAPGQAADEPVGLPVHFGAFLSLAADDQGSTGFIDEDGVHLVHNGIVQIPLDHGFLIDHHVVPQIVKSKFVIGAVGDIAGISLPPLLGGKIVNNASHRKTQEPVDLTHPLGIAAGQIIIDGDDVYALALQCIQIGGKGGYQGLALAGLHFGDTALMQHHAAQQLYIVGAHVHRALGSLPYYGKGLG